MDAAAFVVFTSLLVSRILAKRKASQSQTLIVLDNGVAYKLDDGVEIVHSFRLGSTSAAPMHVQLSYDPRVIRNGRYDPSSKKELDEDAFKFMLNRLMHCITILEKRASPLPPDLFDTLDHFIESAYAFVDAIILHHEESFDTRRIVAFFLIAILQCGFRHRAEGFVRLDTLLAVTMSVVARQPALSTFFEKPVQCTLVELDIEKRIEEMNKFA
jgi:hypothetical protein